VAAMWLEQLPNDLSWRATALARHRDIVEWVLPRTGLSDEDIARTVAHAGGLTPAAERHLLEFLRRIPRPSTH
jgi:hypothetical protein